jgi:hypothetical protein
MTNGVSERKEEEKEGTGDREEVMDEKSSGGEE